MNWEWIRNITGWVFGAIGFFILITQGISGRPEQQLRSNNATTILFDTNPYGAQLKIGDASYDAPLMESYVWIQNSGEKILIPEEMRGDRNIKVQIGGEILDSRIVSISGSIVDASLKGTKNDLALVFKSFDPDSYIQIRILWKPAPSIVQSPVVSALGVSSKSLFFTSKNDIARKSALVISVLASFAIMIALLVTIIKILEKKTLVNAFTFMGTFAFCVAIAGGMIWGSIMILADREPTAFADYKHRVRMLVSEE